LKGLPQANLKLADVNVLTGPEGIRLLGVGEARDPAPSTTSRRRHHAGRRTSHMLSERMGLQRQSRRMPWIRTARFAQFDLGEEI
jgi:hypothetical protein